MSVILANRTIRKRRRFPSRTELARFDVRAKLTDESRANLATLSRDELERLALHLASTRYVTQEDGRPAILEPLPKLAARLPAGVRFVQVTSRGRTPPKDSAIPIDEGEAAFVIENYSGEEGSYVFAMVVRADRLPHPQIDEAEQERIAARLAEALFEELAQGKGATT